MQGIKLYNPFKNQKYFRMNFFSLGCLFKYFNIFSVPLLISGSKNLEIRRDKVKTKAPSINDWIKLIVTKYQTMIKKIIAPI